VLSPSDVRELIHDRLYPMFRAERDRLAWIDKWMHAEHEPLDLPANPTKEQLNLRDLARTPWLSLVVASTVQGLVVDGYRSPEQSENSTAWSIWERNGWAARQVPVHRAAVGYGYAYGKALPGEINGERKARLTAVDPSQMLAVYGDPVDDEWPLYALQGEPTKNEWLMRLYDEEREHFVHMSAAGDKLEYVEWREHNAGVCPVVRYAPRMDLKGRAWGEVEPFITLAKRLNKNVHDRLMAQHYNSWKIRYATGIDLGKGLKEPTAESTIDEWNAYRAEIERRRIKLGQSEMLVAREHDTKFGTLDETPLEGFVKVDESDRETLAAVSQTPSTTLTGKVSNLSAEAIAEIRAGLSQKQDQDKRALRESHNQLLRLGAHIEGDEEAAQDFRSRVTWQDTEIRSLSQAVDAYGKAATMLEVPARALWGRIPGVEQADVEEWETMARRQAGRVALDAITAAAATARSNPTVADLAARRGDAS
jgi:hypothetical protein